MSAQSTTTPIPRSSNTRAVVAGSFGNIMENYDNMVYGYTAVTLGTLFFPESDGLVGTLYTFAVFAVGFLMRPLGAITFGHVGDKFGRRTALVVSVLMMGAATTLIGLLPTYDSIGVLAPLLLVILRMVQGFSVAGEWAGSAAFLVEYAPARRRGFFGSFNQVSTAGGFLLASGVVALNHTIFTDEQVNAFAWRIPFLLSLLTAAAALWLRYGMAETPAFAEEQAKGATAKSPLREGVRTEFPGIARGFGFTMLWTVAYFFFLTYLPTWLTDVAGVDPGVARASNIVGLVTLTVCIAAFGALSDRVGRKPLLTAAAIGFLVLSWPIMTLLQSGGTFGVYAGQIVIAVILAMFSGPGPAALSELFPTKLRYSTMSIGYNFAVMAFGGTAPFVATGVVELSGSGMSPVLLPIVSAAVTLAVVLGMRETAHRNLH
ncbi:MFS transporter [Nonomuraea sp. K274]|uniref:Putative proline/betaine transporter n=1 Tax=Nonomuraea cypriaca TaxID=1187855 RepID=A0A931AKN9_9ACTN|nr:MFS transporter [Nonomuraea cypriaca]MBF8193515.1 MFS transporter [Nonomuraea cypriaca]